MARRLEVNRGLTWFHRWAGVVLCLLFLMWLASGAVLHFIGFPSLPDGERFTRSAVIDTTAIGVAPAQALASVPGAEGIALVAIGDEPVYLVSSPTAAVTRISARDGSQLPVVDAAAAGRIAVRFAGASGMSRIGAPLEYDQWVVHQHFDPYRPFYRVNLTDAAGTSLYVSAQTGQVLQRTDARNRAWNWAGAIVHWIYFTPLRQNWSAWNQVVWWLSLAALLSALAGTWLGISRWLAQRRAKRPGLSPFRGWMRWHHIIGLFASVLVLAYIYSGWLSMDHGRLFSRGFITVEQRAAYAGATLDQALRGIDVDRLRALPRTTEVDFNVIAGQPFLAVRGGVAAAAASIAPSSLQQAVAAAWPGAMPAPDDGSPRDAMFRLAEGAPNSARAFVTSGADPVRIYADAANGDLLVAMNASRRAYAWTYYALHTFNFPVMLAHPRLCDAMVLLWMAIGVGFSLTGVVLAVRVLRR